jgi:hypothetical protein
MLAVKMAHFFGCLSDLEQVERVNCSFTLIFCSKTVIESTLAAIKRWAGLERFAAP